VPITERNVFWFSEDTRRHLDLPTQAAGWPQDLDLPSDESRAALERVRRKLVECPGGNVSLDSEERDALWNWCYNLMSNRLYKDFDSAAWRRVKHVHDMLWTEE
jgi:hypothetical protein